jgi:hypothetical protein
LAAFLRGGRVHHPFLSPLLSLNFQPVPFLTGTSRYAIPGVASLFGHAAENMFSSELSVFSRQLLELIAEC